MAHAQETKEQDYAVTIRLTRPLEAGTTNDSHHLAVRQIEAISTDKHPIHLTPIDGSPLVMMSDRPPSACVDGSMDTISHSAYGRELADRYGKEAHWMEFGANTSHATDVEEIVIRIPDVRSDRIVGCVLELKENSEIVQRWGVEENRSVLRFFVEPQMKPQPRGQSQHGTATEEKHETQFVPVPRSVLFKLVNKLGRRLRDNNGEVSSIPLQNIEELAADFWEFQRAENEQGELYRIQNAKTGAFLGGRRTAVTMQLDGRGSLLRVEEVDGGFYRLHVEEASGYIYAKSNGLLGLFKRGQSYDDQCWRFVYPYDLDDERQPRALPQTLTRPQPINEAPSGQVLNSRETKVCVKNSCGEDLASVTLEHKFGKKGSVEIHDFVNIKNNTTTAPDMTVHYKTLPGSDIGVRTTWDWWRVCFVTMGGDVFHSDPYWDGRGFKANGLTEGDADGPVTVELMPSPKNGFKIIPFSSSEASTNYANQRGGGWRVVTTLLGALEVKHIATALKALANTAGHPELAAVIVAIENALNSLDDAPTGDLDMSVMDDTALNDMDKFVNEILPSFGLSDEQSREICHFFREVEMTPEYLKDVTPADLAPLHGFTFGERVKLCEKFRELEEHQRRCDISRDSGLINKFARVLASHLPMTRNVPASHLFEGSQAWVKFKRIQSEVPQSVLASLLCALSEELVASLACLDHSYAIELAVLEPLVLDLHDALKRFVEREGWNVRSTWIEMTSLTPSHFGGIVKQALTKNRDARGVGRNVLDLFGAAAMDRLRNHHERVPFGLSPYQGSGDEVFAESKLRVLAPEDVREAIINAFPARRGTYELPRDSDSVYCALSYEQLDYVWKNSSYHVRDLKTCALVPMGELQFEPEQFDCDAFANVFRGRVIESCRHLQLKKRAGMAFGVAVGWSLMLQCVHALNWSVDERKQLVLFEPQDGSRVRLDEFVPMGFNLSVGPYSGSRRQLAPRGMTSKPSTEPRAGVTQNQLMSFVTGLPTQLSDDVLNSTLLAEQVANHRAPLNANGDRDVGHYFKTFADCCQTMGWVTQKYEFNDFSSFNATAKVQEEVLAILGAGAGNDAEVIVETKKAMEKLRNDEHALSIFNHRESHARKRGISLAHCGHDGGSVTMAMSFYDFESSDSLEHVLWMSFGSAGLRMRSATMVWTFDQSLFATLREDVLKKLGTTAKSAIVSWHNK